MALTSAPMTAPALASASVLGVVYALTGRALCRRPGRAEEFRIGPDFACLASRRLVIAPAAERLRIVASRSHGNPETDASIGRFPDAETVAMSSFLKFCMIAAGAANLYPR